MSKKEELIQCIVRHEWKQFQQVKDVGGRAECQNDWQTFSIMRTSQFLTWDAVVLESYLADLDDAEKKEWNLMTEKYARMMADTHPAEYKKLAEYIPAQSQEHMQLQEKIIHQELIWAEELEQKYPALRSEGRSIYQSDNNNNMASIETYLRGELGTYSDRTLRLYFQMIENRTQAGINMEECNLQNMTKFYGYSSLEQAEKFAIKFTGKEN